MRAVIQRVHQAAVSIEGATVAAIGGGLMILLGIEEADCREDAEWLASRIARLRIFPDQMGVMNLSLLETDGEALVVSQFTLHASTKKGNRPSYIRAAGPGIAVPLYEHFIHALETALGKKVGTGRFGAMMDVSLVNSGPVTILIDTKNKE